MVVVRGGGRRGTDGAAQCREPEPVVIRAAGLEKRYVSGELKPYPVDFG